MLILDERLLEVKLPRCTVFLYPSEIQALLRQDTNLYKEGLRRGKYISRKSKQKKREQEKFQLNT